MKDRRYWLVAAAALLLTGTLLRADIIGPLPFTFTNGQVIDASQFNSNFAAIRSNVNTNAANAGANTNITSLTGLTTAITPALGGSSRYYSGTSTGAANAQIITVTPNNFSLVVGYEVSFFAGFTNTSAMTLAVGGTAAKNVMIPTGSGPVPLVGGEVIANTTVSVVYDGVEYQLIGIFEPIGSIKDFAGATVPAGWLITNGTSVLRASYPGLFNIIGTTFGSADGTHFNIPDLRGRMTVALDSGANRITTATCSAPSTLGTGCGAQNYTVAQANLPNVSFTNSGIATGDTTAYTFGYSNGSYTAGGSPGVATMVNSGGGATITPTKSGAVSISDQGSAASGGSGTALAVLNPAMVLNKIIKY